MLLPASTITRKLSFYQSSAKGRLDSRVLRHGHVNCHDLSKMKLQNERKLESKTKGKTLEETASRTNFQTHYKLKFTYWQKQMFHIRLSLSRSLTFSCKKWNLWSMTLLLCPWDDAEHKSRVICLQYIPSHKVTGSAWMKMSQYCTTVSCKISRKVQRNRIRPNTSNHI